MFLAINALHQLLFDVITVNVLHQPFYKYKKLYTYIKKVFQKGQLRLNELLGCQRRLGRWRQVSVYSDAFGESDERVPSFAGYLACLNPMGE